MVKTVQDLKFEPTHLDVDEEKIEALEQQRLKASKLGFLAKADSLNGEIGKLRNMSQMNETMSKIEELKELGYFIIKMPEWDDEKEVEGGLKIPYLRVGNVSRTMAGHMDFQALFLCNIQNFVGDIPECVYDAVELNQSKFREFAILFVARISKLGELVKNFVRQDPILLGLTENGYGAVLKMWGDDLKEIDLALLDEDSKSNL